MERNKRFPKLLCVRIWRNKNNKTNRILKKALNQDGYEIVQLWKNGKGSMKKVHRLVLEAYKPIKDMVNYEVNHLDRNRKNNNLNNLEWCSNKQNISYRDKDDNPNKKTKKIKVEYLNGTIEIYNSLTECAKHFDIAINSVRDYIRKELTSKRKVQARFTYI